MAMHSPVAVITFGDVIRAFYAHRRLLGFASLCGAVIGVLWYIMLPQRFTASLLLDIVRVAPPAATTAYTYDTYYRLQADEQFAITVEQWLKTARVTDDTLRGAHIETDQLSLRARERYFDAHQVSPQSVAVAYSVTNPSHAYAIATAMVAVLNARIKDLDTHADAQLPTFAVRSQDPVVTPYVMPLWGIALGGAILGCGCGAGIVAIRSALMNRSGSDAAKKHIG